MGIDFKELQKAVWLAVRFLDNVITASTFPLDEIALMAVGDRRIGLGVMGWADALMDLGIPYSSKEALDLADSVMYSIRLNAELASKELAKEKGSCSISFFSHPKRRNATVLSIAPTGTISIIAGCSSGIEPLFALSYDRIMMEGAKLNEVNQHFLKQIESGLFTEEEQKDLLAQVQRLGMVIELPERFRSDEKMSHLFDVAGQIDPKQHVKMQAVFQKYVDAGVSKTVNLPFNATKEDVADIYALAYKLRCKGITIYRNGSRKVQVLNTAKQGKTVEEPKSESVASPRKREVITHGTTEQIQTGCGKLYVTVNSDDKGMCEVFAQMGKAGGCTASQAEATGRLASLAARGGIAPEEIAKQLRGIRCPNPCWMNGEQIHSCSDAIGKAIAKAAGIVGEHMQQDKVKASDNGLCPQCPECGGMMEFQEGCGICRNCGYSQCG
jgi:ribonucleoside-diphosphate reductase alpha chain